MSKKLTKRLAERDSVNTPWNQPANPKAEELLTGKKEKKMSLKEASDILKYRV